MAIIVVRRRGQVLALEHFSHLQTTEVAGPKANAYKWVNNAPTQCLFHVRRKRCLFLSQQHLAKGL